MNRKQLLALIKSMRQQHGFAGKSFADFKSFCDDNLISDFNFGEGKSFKIDDVEAAWETKAVTITADAGEEIIVVEDDAETLEMDDEEAEDKAGDDEVEAKSVRKARGKSLPDSVRKARSVGIHSGKAISRDEIAMKRYDNAVKTGAKLRGGHAPIFHSAERAEVVGAIFRKAIWGGTGYAQEHADDRIIETKAGSTQVNSTGGALVYGEYIPELIENIDEAGALRRACGVTSMSEGTRIVSRISSDVTVYDVGENNSITDSDPTFGNVDLVAKKSGVVHKFSNEHQNDSAFSVADYFTRSSARAIGKWEDEGGLLGQNNREGIADKLGANSRFDTNSGGWNSITQSDITDTMSKLAEWSYDDPNFAIIGSLTAYHSVFLRLKQAAGGNTGTDLATGFGGGLSWNGIPYIVSSVMPKSYVDGQDLFYIGAWGDAAKFGVVTGSEQIASTTEGGDAFINDQTWMRFTQRWATALHDVNNDANGSGIVALQA